MNCSSQILRMVFIIITCILVLISMQSTHIFTADASLYAAEEYFIRAHGGPRLHYMAEKEHDNEKQVQKVAGEDEKEKEALILQKVRALLGLKSFKKRRSTSEYVSPAPSPSLTTEVAEIPAPAPAPMLPIHLHSHPPLHHSRQNLPPHKLEKQHRDKGGHARVLVAVFVSAGAGFLVCVIGLIWFSAKFGKHKKTAARTMSVYMKKGRRTGGISKFGSSSSTHKSASTVRLNPGLDILCLNSLSRDLEQQTTYLKQNPETANTPSNPSTPTCTLHEREASNQELIMKSESDNASSSSTREITSVHEDIESAKYDSDGGNSSPGDKIIPIECHSSDDESFHSFVDSHSSNIRLSNASAGSLTDVSEISPLNVPKAYSSSPPPSTSIDIPQSNPASNVSPKLLQSPNKYKADILTDSSPAAHGKTFTAPPPPPPPPPPLPLVSPIVCLRSSKSPSWSTKMASRASPSSTLSPRKLESSGPNRAPSKDLPASPRKSPRPLGTPSSIPPPPCPPPILTGNTSSAKTPPPPPSQLPQFTPVGKDGAPLPKLKPLHWDKVRAAPDRNMVWDKIRSSSFELDEQMIESLFGYNLQTTMRTDEAKSKTPSPSKHVLEPKRLQNITILLKALNASAEQVCEALIRGAGLSLQQLEALAKMVPTKEEESKLFGYKGDINELGSAEKFVRVVLSTPLAFLRVEAMLYKESFEDEVIHLRNSFSMLEEACKELRSSRLFLKLLEAVLKTGNRMNVGTVRGGARAFKLDALLKLADVKGTDGKTTLLHFVVQEIVRSEGIRASDSIMGKINQKNKSQTVEEREEDYRRMGLDLVSGLSTELYNVKKTAAIDMDVLASSVSNLSEGMAKLQHLVNKDLSTDEKSGNFVHSMKTFLRYAERKLKELKEDEDRVLLHVREITEYFHGDVSKEEANPLRIFVIVRDFLGMLDHVCKELRSLKVPSSPNPLAPFR